MKGYLTKTQTAERLGCNTRAVDRWIREGYLISLKTDTNASQQITLITEASVNLWEQKRDTIESIERNIAYLQTQLEKERNSIEKELDFLRKVGVAEIIANGIVQTNDIALLKALLPNDEDAALYRVYIASNYNMELTGVRFNFSKERTRQMINKAYKSIYKKINVFVENLLIKDQKLEAENQKLVTELGVLKRRYGGMLKTNKGPDKIADIDTSFLLTRLSDIDLPIRIIHRFNSFEIYYVFELLVLNERDLKYGRNFGKVSFADLKEWMKENGVHFETKFTESELQYLKENSKLKI